MDIQGQTECGVCTMVVHSDDQAGNRLEREVGSSNFEVSLQDKIDFINHYLSNNGGSALSPSIRKDESRVNHIYGSIIKGNLVDSTKDENIDGLEHESNVLHLYCRLRDKSYSHSEAMEIAIFVSHNNSKDNIVRIIRKYPPAFQEKGVSSSY